MLNALQRRVYMPHLKTLNNDPIGISSYVPSISNLCLPPARCPLHGALVDPKFIVLIHLASFAIRMLTGVPPFEVAMPARDPRCRVVAVEQCLGELLNAWRMSLSEEVVDLMQSCLTFDPSQRPSLEQLRNHPWITETLP